MRRWWIGILLLGLLTGKAAAVEIPENVLDALPSTAEELIVGVDPSDVQGFSTGIENILDAARMQIGDILRQRVRGAASVLLVAILCGAAAGFSRGTAGKTAAFLPMAGALSITGLTAGSLDDLIGLGAETIRELTLFSKALLPTLAAATAASGAVTTASFHQVTTVFLVDLLLNLIDYFLLPLVYLYIGVLTAKSCLPENQLGAIADGLKKVLTKVLTTALMGFTMYLSIVRIISGAVDETAVKMTKATISNVVPVVGGIIADAAETVLAGAGLLKNTVGILGMLAILAVCLYPFLQLGIQYLLYKLTAFLAGTVGSPELCRLIDGLGGAFGLVLGMTGSCALLLLVSIISSIAAVGP